MNLARFQAILDAYGALPERWPAPHRSTALAFARSSVPAARALARARALDEALQAMEVSDIAEQPAQLAALQSRIVMAARPLMRTRWIQWLGFDMTPRQLWPSVAGLALATLLGFAVGVGGLIQGKAQIEHDDAIVLPSTDPLLGGMSP